MSRMGPSPQAGDPDVQVAIISGVGTDPEGFGHLVKSALIYGDRITITDPCHACAGIRRTISQW